jgi:hypothetical protein
MRLPSYCPYATKTPRRPPKGETIACCRYHGVWLPDALEPLCSRMRTKTEVYRFCWSSSFDGDAVIRIGRQDDRISLQATHGRGFIGSKVETDIQLSRDNWRRLQDALIRASFWTLDIRDDRIGFDGATWTIEGRRRDIYHVVERWSPDYDAIWRLGRLLFDLAGFTGMRLY